MSLLSAPLPTHAPSATTQPVYNATTQVPTVAVDVNASFVASVVMCALSASVFVFSCVLLLCYQRNKSGAHIIESRIGLVAFFLGALLTTITTLSAHTQVEVYSTYVLVLELAVGIAVLAAGTLLLFETLVPGRALADQFRRAPSLPVGHNHGSLGVIIWVVTLPLCVIEMFFTIGAITKSPHHIYAAVEFVSFVQKLVQASVYYFSLRHKVPKSHIRMGCAWFLKILSLLNFAFWIDSVVRSRSDNQFVQELFGKGFSIIKTSYNALLIDYRLLCCVVFLEHALEIEESSRAQLQGGYEAIEEFGWGESRGSAVNVDTSHNSGYGYIIGLVCIALQLVNGLQYLDFVGSWTNLWPILADVFVVVLGLCLLFKNMPRTESQYKWRDTESKAIDVMIGFMGAMGFVFWFMKAVFCSLWTVQYSNSSMNETFLYLAWTSAKDFVRAFGILFQLHFFVKMGPSFCSSHADNRHSINHFLVPAIMLALLSLFVAAIIDQYNGQVEQLLTRAGLDQAIGAFFHVAAPIHLGFCLHMFLHFFVMNRRMSRDVFTRRERAASDTLNVNPPAAATQETGQPSSSDDKYGVETKGEETRPLLAQASHHQPSDSTMSNIKTI